MKKSSGVLFASIAMFALFLFILADFALTIGVIYIVLHFVTKFW